MFVEKGRGRVQRRGEPMKELGPGEVDYTPPGVEHWHGAAPNDDMIQLAVVVGGGGIQFKTGDRFRVPGEGEVAARQQFDPPIHVSVLTRRPKGVGRTLLVVTSDNLSKMPR